MRPVTLFFLLFLSSSLLPAQIHQVKPLPMAHSHNDYEHDRPLLDALAHGFTSVEADVHLIGSELFVYHDKPSIPDSNRTLANLYLNPLRQRIHEQGGSVYPGYDAPFFLMIDIKTEGEATYRVLQKQLRTYESILTTDTTGPVLVFLSGNRPVEVVAHDRMRLVALDGRPGDLGKGYSPDLMPVISDHYRNHLRWNGQGALPADQERHLRDLAARVHAEGKRLRLWASPEKETVWQTLIEAGVDLINTDKLAELQVFLMRKN